MKTFYSKPLLGLSLLLACGCAHHLIYVVVDSKYVAIESSQNNGLTAAQATRIFHQIVNEFNLESLPTQIDSFSTQYEARSDDGKLSVVMDIEKEKIRFISSYYRGRSGTGFEVAENVAKKYELSLDNLHIKYEVQVNHDSLLGP
jgi:hypothetical protein